MKVQAHIHHLASVEELSLLMDSLSWRNTETEHQKAIEGRDMTYTTSSVGVYMSFAQSTTEEKLWYDIFVTHMYHAEWQ